MAHHSLVVHPLVLRHVQVVRVDDVSPRMRRITVSGEQLGAFAQGGLELPAFATPAFDDHVKLIFAADDDVRSVLPTQLEHGIEWDPAPARQGRDYTPRRYDPETGELDLDFVLHGDGPAASWAQSARPGAELWFAGPKSSTMVPENADRVLLLGDETALPAIGRFLEERPLGAPVRAVIAIADPSARQELAVRDGDVVEWVIAEPGDETTFADAVGAMEQPPGKVYIWAAAESRSLFAVRRLARAWGVPKTHVNITGYWHRRTDEPATSLTSEAPAALPQPPIEWFAVRAALRIGLIDAVADAAVPVDELARRLEVSAERLRVLVEALAAGGILVEDAACGVRLGRLGEDLAEDEHTRERFTGLAAEQALALEALPEAMSAGPSAWDRTYGRTLRAAAVADRSRYEEFVEDAEGAASVLTGLSSHPVWAGRRSVAVTGPGAVAVCEALGSGRDARMTIVEAPEPLEVLRGAIGDPGSCAFSEAWGEHDLVVTALALDHRTDDEARELLAELRGAAATAVLIEQLTPDGLGAGAGSTRALTELASLGTPVRTPEIVLGLARSAGWTVSGRRKLGWGIECVELVSAAPEQ